MTRGARIVLVAAVLLLFGLGAVRLIDDPGRTRPREPSAMRVGPTPPATPIDFSLVLRLPGAPRLREFLRNLYDPRSSSFHRFIDASAFGARFGLSRHALRATIRTLVRDGVRITGEYPQRTALDARAPAGVVERLFGVRLIDHVGRGGRRFFAPSGRPSVPAALTSAVSAVAGLDGRPALAPDDVPADGVDPSTAAAAYDAAPLYRLGIEGQGESVAVISFGTFTSSNLEGFDRQFGLPTEAPVQQGLLGGATDHTADTQEEVQLDLEIAHAIAPRAQLLDYNAPFETGRSLGVLLDRIVADGRADIVTDSYGQCERDLDPADIERDEQAIEAAQAHGVTIFKSSGDAGAYYCQNTNRADHRLSVEWPASSPGVVAVGGTSLSVGQGGAYAGETAWQDALSQQGGGGGLSVIFPRPTWQRGIGVINRYSNGRREVPDVSANADPASGWSVFQGGRLTQAAGTSAASPFWAAAAALIEQYAREHGVRKLGFLDPVLYAVDSRPEPFPPFHDVTVGTNRYYPATQGWDLATGLGSPDVYNLARDIVAYLRTQRATG